MRARDDDALDPLDPADEAERAFLRTLAGLGEPAQVAPPPDLVTRTARRLPHLAPAAAARRERSARLVASFAALALVALAAGGLWLALAPGAGPAGAPGAARTLLVLQLALRPLLATLELAGAPLLAVGVAAAVASGIVARRPDEPGALQRGA